MKYKVSELEGAMLDAAVAKASGHAFHFDRHGICLIDIPPGWKDYEPLCSGTFMPHRLWGHGGPIIERERILIGADEKGGWSASHATRIRHSSFDDEIVHDNHWGSGPTPLIAAMRAYVSAEMGDEVELP